MKSRSSFRYLGVVALVVASIGIGLVGSSPAYGDPGDGGRNHNDSGPGTCGHTHGYFNTSVCTQAGAGCFTGGGKAGNCRDINQQCYCIEDAGVAKKDAGVKVPDPTPDHMLGQR